MPKRRIRRGHGQPCYWCKRTMIGHSDTALAHPLLVTRDHVVPQHAHGGDEGNVVLCCRACNHIKGAMSPQEWAAYRAARPEWWKGYK